ncbi:MAG: colicin production family protein [Micavibrio sp.]|nr:colicin production family protein [Micavibrio sp.]
MIFDIIVLVAVLISAFIALLRGFIRELLTIVGVGGGVLAAVMGGPFLLPAMNKWLDVPVPPEKMTKIFDLIPRDMAAMILSYGVIFVLVVIVLSVLSYFLASGAKAAGLGPVDRALGFVFGVGRAVLLLSLLYLPVYKMAKTEERNAWFKGSMTRPYVEMGSEWIASLMPDSGEKHDDKDADGKSVDARTKDAQTRIKEAGDKFQQIKGLQESAGKAGALLEDAKKDAREKLDELKGAPTADDKEGYKEDQRKDLNQLIRTNQ